MNQFYVFLIHNQDVYEITQNFGVIRLNNFCTGYSKKLFNWGIFEFQNVV